MNFINKLATGVINGVMVIGSALAYLQLTAFVLLCLLIIVAIVAP